MKHLAWWRQGLNYGLGKYLKSYFERHLGDQFFWHEEQERNWQALRRSLKSAAIFHHFKLEKIKSYQDYLQYLPPTTYLDYQKFIALILEGKTNILFAGSNQYFGLTSGTSGKDSKKIPYNREMISLFQNAQKIMAGQLVAHGNLQPLSSQRFAYGSNPICQQDGKFTYGYISGILSAHLPELLAKNSFPSKEVLAMENWEQKLEKIYQSCATLDIEIVSGIPNYLITIMEYLLQRSGKKAIAQLWPGLHTMVYGATPITQYQERINRIVGKNLNYYGLYASTEAPLGLPVNNAAFNFQEYTLVPGVIYSFTHCLDAETILGVMDLRVGEEYLIHVGTPNGLLQYQMQDIIKIIRLHPYISFEVMGREGSLLNLAAEKTSESHLLNAVEKTGKDLQVSFDHHMVYPSEKMGEACYCWVLFASNGKNEALDLEILAQRLDVNLMKFNEDYKDCRDDRIIFPPAVEVLSSDLLSTLFARNKDRGQFKMKTSFPSQISFENYFQENLNLDWRSLDFHHSSQQGTTFVNGLFPLE